MPEYRFRSPNGYITNTDGHVYGSVEAAYEALDIMLVDDHTEVVEIVPVPRPEAKDCLLVWENTGNPYSATRMTLTEANEHVARYAAINSNFPGIMVMRLVPVNDAP